MRLSKDQLLQHGKTEPLKQHILKLFLRLTVARARAHARMGMLYVCARVGACVSVYAYCASCVFMCVCVCMRACECVGGGGVLAKTLPFAIQK